MSTNQWLLIWRLSHKYAYIAFAMPIWMYALYDDCMRVYLLDDSGIAYAICFTTFDFISIAFAFAVYAYDIRIIWYTFLTFCIEECKLSRYDITFHRHLHTCGSIEFTLKDIGFQDTAQVITSFLQGKYINLNRLENVVSSLLDQLARVDGNQSHDYFPIAALTIDFAYGFNYSNISEMLEE